MDKLQRALQVSVGNSPNLQHIFEADRLISIVNMRFVTPLSPTMKVMQLILA